jgi:acyl-CoA thioesterase-1
MPRLLLAVLLCLATAVAGCLPQSGQAAGPRPVSYIAIGASDSVGVGTRDPEREAWVSRFHAHLPPGSTLVNLGVSGSRLDQALEQQLPVAAGLHPDLVTVWLAVNDLNASIPLERYSAELDTLLTGLETTGATVLVGNVPDLALLPAYKGVDPRLLEARVEAWNRVIAEGAARHGALLVDLRALSREQSEHPEYVSTDGFHPSSEGHVRLAELFWAVLQANGGLGSRSG